MATTVGKTDAGDGDEIRYENNAGQLNSIFESQNTSYMPNVIDLLEPKFDFFDGLNS